MIARKNVKNFQPAGASLSTSQGTQSSALLRSVQMFILSVDQASTILEEDFAKVRPIWKTSSEYKS